jgi:NADH:ubiquinone oxidoreductase subunit 4 (subunit M)
MVLVAAFTLRALKQSFFGETERGVRLQESRLALDPDWNEQQSITVAEKCGACLLMFATLAVGVYPKLLLDRIMPAVEAMRFLK